MNLLKNSLDFVAGSTAATLLSASCIGNDGKSCPLFHGSLAPMIFGGIHNESQFLALEFLVHSNTITWVSSLHLPRDDSTLRTLIDILSKARYFSRSLKRLSFHAAALREEHVAAFLQNNCPVVESIDIQHRNWFVGENIQIVAKSFPRLRSLDLSGTQKLVDEDLALLPKLTNIKELVLNGQDRLFTNSNHLSQTSYICAITSLESLSLFGCANVCDDFIEQIASSLPLLQHLNVAYCPLVTDKSLLHLTSAKARLKSIVLAGCEKVTDAGMSHLSKIPTLCAIDLSRIYNITDAGCEYLFSLSSSLNTLALPFCSQITDAGIKSLAKGGCLENLDITDCSKITDESLKALSGANSPLVVLVLTACSKVTDEGLQHLAKIKTLQKLLLDHCDLIGNEGVKFLSQGGSTNSLQLLDFSNCIHITNEAISHLREGGVKNLIELRLRFSSISSSCLTHLAPISSSLRCLILHNAKNLGYSDSRFSGEHSQQFTLFDGT
jgi:hypothetical protein